MPVERVSFTSNQLVMRSNITRVQLQYQAASTPATTGLKINHLSDDASVISRIFSVRNQVSANETYQKNISHVEFELSFADNQLSQTSDTVQRIHDIALNAANPGIDGSTLVEIGNQLDTLKAEILGYANSRNNDRYVFAGSQNTTQPFTPGSPVVFNGNSLDFLVNISPAVQVDANLDGRRIFLGNVDTAAGGDLATILKSSDGVPLGLAAGDVINIGGSVGSALSGTLTVTSATTLDDIAAFMQSSLRAAGDNTETAAVQPDGSILVTAGATAISNLNLNVTGKTQFNTAFTFPTAISGGGGAGSSDALKSGEGEDIFDVIDDLKAALISGNTDNIQTHISRLETVSHQISDGRSQVGTRMQQVLAGQNFLEDEGVRLLGYLSDLQDADVTDAFSDLVSRETALRLVLESSTRFLNTVNGIDLLS